MDGFIIPLLRELASRDNIDGVHAVTTMPQYENRMGREAIGIALSWGHKRIAYEILSRPNAWKEFKETQFSPFVVLDKMELELSRYVPYVKDR